ncbi:MAG: methyltransferase domain-containing protein [Terracidiphilus sp.]|nr:methyltransferase domain-containing protein [Terracidiphilus sp.]MDR3799231.1 methyltransferase domain-containing protein [Terracidiphilus sp.]
MSSSQHDAEILDQFTRQAEPFAQRHGYQSDPLLDLMADCAEVGSGDTVLDVACGPGIISCFFARRARHVTGIDVVPAMLERARRYQAEQLLTNLTWQLGSSTDLPFREATFDCVITRFSFHHFLQPASALREMKRVAKPNGVVLVCDVVPSLEPQASFNHWEILRDPSHTHALTQAEFELLGEEAGLILQRRAPYRKECDLEDLLAGSFPKPGDAERIRALFDADILAHTDTLGVAARRENGAVRITYPIAVFAWRKPA